MAIELNDKGVFIDRGVDILDEPSASRLDAAEGRNNTMAYRILEAHNLSNNSEELKIRFDALVSHDITYVGIIQTARAGGLEQFPLPYILTNCHNSLCAVGGTINEDDHLFGLSAAQKYGGIYVPANLAVIHQYAREAVAACGAMILGSDSHTRYGALGVLGVGEGGPELVKQLLEKSYDLSRPEVVAVYLDGDVSPGVGPMDVALTIINAVFANGFVKSKIMEFVGPGLGNLSVDFRNGIDVMTTETTCLTSIWMTDDRVRKYYADHHRPESYREIVPTGVAYYDGVIKVDLGRVEPMIALPFHPSNVYCLAEFKRGAAEILDEVEKEATALFGNPKIEGSLRAKARTAGVRADQGIVAGCAGGLYENMVVMAAILEKPTAGSGAFSLSVYPASQPIYAHMIKDGTASKLVEAGAVIKPAFCGPCFGAGDTPSTGALSVRSVTRNFPNREGSDPGGGQFSFVAIMDARSIAATAANEGLITGANEIDLPAERPLDYHFDGASYAKRVYCGYGRPQKEQELILGPNIADWPEMIALPEHLLLKVASFITDAVTTTDELIPSGETSSYRSNPFKLAEFTLKRKDPGYLGRAREAFEHETTRLAALQDGEEEASLRGIFAALEPAYEKLLPLVKTGADEKGDIFGRTGLGSLIYAVKPGDGSAREQAASCQKVLGGWANISLDYATRRYRSNLINWGIIPFTVTETPAFSVGDSVFIPYVRSAVLGGVEKIHAYIVSAGQVKEIALETGKLSDDERKILAAGSLINYYRQRG